MKIYTAKSSKTFSKESWEDSTINFGKSDFDVVYPYKSTANF